MTQQPQHSPDAAQRKPAVSGSKALLFLIVLLVVAVVLAVVGIVPRLRAAKVLQQQTTAMAPPDVLVAPPQVGKPDQEVVLPGNMYAYVDSPINARTNGYLEKWYFDIGAHVKKGQLLAVIASPEVDKQLAQAKQDLATAVANASIAHIQSSRYQDLLKQNAVAAQDTDTFMTQEAATSTQVKSAQANVQRLEELTGFEKIYAPFTGVITARNIDIGTLINAGAGSGPEMFHMSDEHILRVYVNVPQLYSRACVPGVPADITLVQFPDRRFHGKIVRTATAIDPASRTLLVEVDVPNPKGELVPGNYSEVHFNFNTEVPRLIVPVSTLMFRSEGLRVVTVTSDNKAHLVPITIGQDDGRIVQVIQGLQPNDQVVQNPPDSIIDGETVHVVQPRKAGAGEGENSPEGSPNEGGK